jgi:hypothetical protein
MVGKIGVAAQINSGNIGSYIKDLAVGGAKIADAAITNAKIGDLQVDTIKIASGAIGLGTSAYSVQKSYPSASATLTVSLPSGTGTVLVTAYLGFQSGNSGGQVRLIIKRNGTAIFDQTYGVDGGSAFTIPFVDTVTNGTYTYEVSTPSNVFGVAAVSILGLRR